jgi:hypothetical protein
MTWWGQIELKYWIHTVIVQYGTSTKVHNFAWLGALFDILLYLYPPIWSTVHLHGIHNIYNLPKVAKDLIRKICLRIHNFNLFFRTEMGGPNAPLSPAESVKGVLAVLDTFQPEQSGHFYDYTGQPLSWWTIAHSNSSHKTDGAMIFLLLSKQMVLKDKLSFGHMSVTYHTKVKTEANWGRCSILRKCIIRLIW